MRTWQKAALMTLITLAIGGIYLLVVFEHRRNPAVVQQTTARQPETPDDVAEVRAIFPTTFDEVLKLQGTTVWMKNGYTMPYFPFDAGRIVFTKRIGVIPSIQRLDIRKVIKSSPPAAIDDGISHGSRQAFAIFAMPGNATLYATAIGVMGDGQEQYFTDLLFFYDDPHTIYDYWPKNVWAAIDAHQVIPGMSELETRLSIGQQTQSDSESQGNRTVTYDQAGKQWIITFVNNKAITIKAR